MSPTRLLATLLVLFLLAVPVAAGGGPAETVVLVNAKSPESRDVGAHYAAARDLPPSHVLEVSCETGLQTTMDAFTPAVIEPLREFLATRPHVKFVVLTQGLPIRARTTGGNWVSTAAALALCETPFCGRVQGRLPTLRNPYQSGPASKLPALAGGRLLLTTALISSTPREARALVDRSVASDGTAPEDALVIFQDARGNANVRNADYDASRRRLEKMGFRTTHDPAGKDAVRDRKRVIGYVSGGSYSAMTVESLATNEFLPGAVCDMLQSFGAVPENFAPDGEGGKQFPVTHLVRAGITGVHGAVAEPYTVAFPPADLMEPYLAGYTLAEAFHQRIPVAYWMNLVLGDPLCAPYAERPHVDFQVEDGVLGATAPGATRLTVYLDGRPAGSGAGEELTLKLPPVARGEHHVLVQAVGPGETEPVGWTARTVELGLDEVPAEWSRRVDSRGPLVARFAGTPPAPESLTVHLGERELAGAVTRDGATLRFVPEAPLPAGRELTLRSGDRWSGAVVVRAAELTVSAPDSVQAGEQLELSVVLRDAAGEPCEEWSGRVEVHASEPAIRHRALVADASTVDLPLEFTEAGSLILEVRAPGDGLTRTVEVLVEPAAAAHATTPVSKVPVGQVVDLPVVVQDRFGNTVPSAEGTVTAKLPTAPHADLPDAAPLRGGRAVLRDLVLLERRRMPLVLEIDGRSMSQPTEGIEGVSAAVRAWSVSTPERGAAGEALVSALLDGPDAAERALVDGAVVAGATFRRTRARSDEIRFDAAGTRNGDLAVAVTPLEVLSKTRVRVLAASSGPLRISLDGELLHEGAPKATDPRSKPEPVAELELAPGRHLLVVVAERKGRFAFQVRLDDGEGHHPRPVTVTGASAAGETRSVSGRVTRSGGAPLAGVELTVETDTGEHTATTDALGRWTLAELRPGKVVVRVPEGTELSPAERTVDTGAGHVTDLDFEQRDETPPEVTLPDLPRRPRCGARLRLSPTVTDDGGVARLVVLVDGEPLGTPVTKAPWHVDLDASSVEPGRHDVVLVATDAAGNEGRTKAVTFDFVGDDGPPRVELSGIREGRRLRRRSTLTARAEDAVGIADIRFTLNGKPLGETVTDPDGAKLTTAKVSIDPDDLAAGDHVIECIVTDVDGKETRATLHFDTR